MDIVTQNEQTVHCEVQTDSGQTVQCEVLTDSGQTVEGSSGHSDTESTDGTVLSTDIQ